MVLCYGMVSSNALITDNLESFQLDHQFNAVACLVIHLQGKINIVSTFTKTLKKSCILASFVRLSTNDLLQGTVCRQNTTTWL